MTYEWLLMVNTRLAGRKIEQVKQTNCILMWWWSSHTEYACVIYVYRVFVLILWHGNELSACLICCISDKLSDLDVVVTKSPAQLLKGFKKKNIAGLFLKMLPPKKELETLAVCWLKEIVQ